MANARSASRVQTLEMQLEEAIQMLRLVAANKRTNLEVEEWLNLTYPASNNSDITIASLLGLGKE